MPGMVLKEHAMDFIEALAKGSNAIEISYIKQHGLLLLLEIASFLAEVHADNSFYSKLVAKSIAAMTQARASFATGLLVADADYRNFHGFNPWLPIRAICM
jgi:predicted alpha-1,6-mannanase (GH76 family)